jgi:hypothetical protein
MEQALASFQARQPVDGLQGDGAFDRLVEVVGGGFPLIFQHPHFSPAVMWFRIVWIDCDAFVEIVQGVVVVFQFVVYISAAFIRQRVPLVFVNRAAQRGGGLFIPVALIYQLTALQVRNNR